MEKVGMVAMVHLHRLGGRSNPDPSRRTGGVDRKMLRKSGNRKRRESMFGTDGSKLKGPAFPHYFPETARNHYQTQALGGTF